MNKKGQSLNLIIGAFLLIILGSVFTIVLSDMNWVNRNTYLISNETLGDISNVTATQMDNFPVASILYVTNATGALYKLHPASNYTATTGSIYNMYNGRFLVDASVSADQEDWQDLNVSYTYYPSGYVRQSNAKVLLNLIPLFFVIALLLFVVMPILKQFEIF